ncbi:MAG: hypothetical protein RLZZ232_3434 [Planctomycetota bacterium]
MAPVIPHLVCRITGAFFYPLHVIHKPRAESRGCGNDGAGNERLEAWRLRWNFARPQHIDIAQTIRADPCASVV